jgi:Septin
MVIACGPRYYDHVIRVGVKVRLTVVHTHGYGDSLNNTNNPDPIIRYIDDQVRSLGCSLPEGVKPLVKQHTKPSFLHVFLISFVLRCSLTSTFPTRAASIGVIFLTPECTAWYEVPPPQFSSSLYLLNFSLLLFSCILLSRINEGEFLSRPPKNFVLKSKITYEYQFGIYE